MRTPNQTEGSLFRFGIFEVDLAARELRKRGVRVKLQDQPFRVLEALLEKPGEIVTREELKERLWAQDEFVEFDKSLNTAVQKIRQALGDSAESPRFLETVPRIGYRFVAPVQPVPLTSKEAPPPPPPPFPMWPLVVVLAAAGSVVWWWFGQPTDTPFDAQNYRLRQLTRDAGLTFQPTISPDGKLIAYASDRAGRGDLDIWVQQTTGGTPLPLTTDAAEDSEPHFSPDGSRIVFRSERGDGGIYVVSTLGGEPRRIAPLGERPRFSPDGKWIAFRGQGSVNVMPALGGAQIEVARGITPVWAPDSRHLLVHQRGTGPGSWDDWEWVVASLDGGDAVSTGIRDVVANQGLSAPAPLRSFAPSSWRGDSILFSASNEGATKLWEVKIADDTFRISGPARRITSGAGLETDPSTSLDGRWVFSGLSRRSNIWSLELSADGLEAVGDPKRLTSSSANDTHATVTPDAEKVAFVSDRSGARQVWLRDLSTGQESALTDIAANVRTVAISPDGTRVAFSVAQEGRRNLLTASAEPAPPVPLCDECGTVSDWSADGKWLVSYFGAVLSLVEAATGESQPLIRGEWGARAPFDATFSSDGDWLAFHLRTYGSPNERRQVFMAPLWGGGVVPQERWIAVTDDEVSNAAPEWSTNGSVLYFLSNREESTGVWAQTLDPETKEPQGAPRLVFRPAGRRLSFENLDSLAQMRLSVAHGTLFFSLGELTGNIWIMEPNDVE